MPNPFEARDSQIKARGSTHSRIFGGEKQDPSVIQYTRNTELNISETKDEYNTTPNKTRRSTEDMQDDTCTGNSNFPDEETHCRIFGSANTTPEQSDKDTAKGDRQSPTPMSPVEHYSLEEDRTFAQVEDQETLSASGDRKDEVNNGKETKDAQVSKSILRKRKTDLHSRMAETPGKLSNNPKEGTHNRIFGSFSVHDKAPWISSPSVDPKLGHKPFKPQSKTLYTASSPIKERELSRSKKEDTHSRIFGNVPSKYRDLTLAAPMYPKVEADDRTTHSRIFGSNESSAKEVKQPKKTFQNEGHRNPLVAKFDKQLTDHQEANTSKLQQEFKNLSIPPRDLPAEGTVGEKN